MRRWLLFAAGALVAACGSILGVEPLEVDQQASQPELDAQPPPPDTPVDAAPEPIDASAFVDAAPDAQCFQTLPTPPRSVATDGSQRNPWTGLDNVKSQNNQAAVSADCCYGNVTQALIASDFGFSIPPTAQIQGLDIHTRARATNSASVTDNGVHVLAGKGVGADLSKPDVYPGAFQDRDYGGSFTTGGLALTPDLVNDPSFSVAISAKVPNVDDFAITFEVDVVQVSLLYCLPPSQ